MLPAATAETTLRCSVNNPFLWLDPDGLSPLTSQPAAQPAPTPGAATQPTIKPTVDKSKVCCKYSYHYGHKGGRAGTFTGPARRFQKTHSCKPGVSNPKSCCDCPSYTERKESGGYGGISWSQLSVDDATWGKCCWCDVYYSRARGEWYMHAVVSMKCTNGRSLIADHSMSGGLPYWLDEDVEKGTHGRGSGFPPAHYPVVVKKTRVDCDTGERLIEWVKSVDNPQLKYGWIHDCHWFAGAGFRCTHGRYHAK